MSAFLTIPKIIEFFKTDLEHFQEHSRKLVLNSRNQFHHILKTDPISIGDIFLGQMISFFLPKNVDTNLKSILWKEHKIEIPIFEWKNRKLIRLSAYAYNDQKDINSLMNALRLII